MSEVTEEVPKETIPEVDGDSQKQEIEKLKKVVQIFQNKLKTQNTKIAEMTKQSELKDKIISAAKENLEKIQNERDKKVQELEDLKLKKGGASLDMFEGQTPEAVIERIQVQNTVWCLVKFPDTQQYEDSDDEDEMANANMLWISQDELIEHVNTIGCTLDLPPFSLSSTQASQLRSELTSLQQSYDKLEEEYKKYRVDMELLVWNKNNQIDSLKSTNTELPLFTTQGTSSTAASQDSIESLRIQKQAMKEKNVELTRKIDSLTLDVEELKLSQSDSQRKIELLKNECDEWRRKYKEEVKKKQGALVEKQVDGVTDKETIESLKQEIDYLRSKNEQMLLLVKKSNEGASTKPAVPSPTPEVSEIDINGNDLLTKNKYLRSLFYNYLCARDKNSRNHMQTALMTIFQFTPEEVMEIRRKASSSWF